MGLREEKKQETRRAIVDTTLAMVRRSGFERTRVQDVADRLRISEATFFNYFPTKHSVLESVADDLFDQSIDRLERDLDGERPIPARLEALVRAFAADLSNDRQLAVLLAEHTTFFSAAPSERRQRAHRLVTALFAEGQRRGEIRTDVAAERLATLSMAVTMATVQAWVTVEGGGSLEERLVEALDVLLAGCARPPVSASRRRRPR